jgi:nucleotide-binding universal stress UspA family protein
MGPADVPRRIVVGVDESDGAADALRWAVAEAGFDGARVTAVLVSGPFTQHHLLESASWDAAYGQPEAHAALVRSIEMAVGDDAADRVEAQAVVNLPYLGLVEQAAAADLLVVGARGLGGFRGLLLGSLSQQCLHHAQVPLAIIRAALVEPAVPRRVVVAIDGSADAQRALGWAIAAARRRSAMLDVVHAWEPPFPGSTPFGRGFYDVDVIREASERMLERAVAAENTTDVEVRTRSLASPTVRAILTDGADVLVVGSRGCGATPRMSFGSVATQVSHHAPCPLVVVPAPER